ncbi:hypothetical protein MJR27_28290 [Klebsiella pneumoniae]|uniref:hypothetical protein n=1 Tax=Klebsiella pneumoniae TaxID=573 RepID=UPI00201190B6|nr:hypothetical protein [Klebsiella pneumoniae]MCL1541938.1 hypothetical protein [Klebsiella pneumoniae]MCL7699822.1 hypothetical protein [Klebsiella pneumoniae]USP93601.1 hypothetical protein MKT41_28290 [Klebsiella pneumoniae]
MINKIKAVELNERDILQRFGDDVVLINKLPHNIYTNEKGVLIENPLSLTDKLLSVSVGVNRYGFSVLYVALLVEVIEKLKSMDQEERNKALSIISRKAYSIKQMIPKIEKRKMQLFVPEKTLEEIQNLLPNLFKTNLIPALIDYAIDLKEKSGSVFLFECHQEG